MERLLDVYTITAGDVALAYAGRGYNCKLGNWLTVSGGNLGSSRVTRQHLLEANFGIHDGVTGGFKDGCYVEAWILRDSTDPSQAIPWFQGIQSKSNLVFWRGKTPLDAGFFWRIHQGGLVAGDYVGMGVGYE
jgi:hypothetical protein